MNIRIPRLLVAGFSGDSGKTIASLSLLTALRQKELAIAVFKKGPDYIDAAWLSRFAGSEARNLDTYLVDPAKVRKSFLAAARRADFALIEGNRGIFDGKDAEGTHSTAELAKLLEVPVVLVVNATKATRTLAALIRGCIDFDPGVNIAGVILNRVAGRRHEKIITAALEKYCNVPVLGVIPKLDRNSALLPGRHLGLITPFEFEGESLLQQQLSQIARDYLDIDSLTALADSAVELEVEDETISSAKKPTVRVGYFKDAVFTFYYPENLEALQREGAELVPVSSLEDDVLPEIDALYIGGGFPETHAEKLVKNASLMQAVRDAVENGLPVYAECGGLIYLSRSLTWHDQRYSMAEVFPVDLVMNTRPAGHGYTLMRADRSNPFFEPGTTLKGHEFHYSTVTGRFDETATCLSVQTGFGLGQQRDGLLYKNCLACFAHLHADGAEKWAPALAANAAAYRKNVKRCKKKANKKASRPRPAIKTLRLAEITE
ncbi:MAG: hydrogenobyrinic acid a,c-diamide synthase (glutamine-hydrolyzing) [candidate division Zixibacteria bacterium]|nr:hydrogenobyrinic acid a,c-diamide synthase (glutamine-hydrolyzing) [candidate division Zixibacteria bacterium]